MAEAQRRLAAIVAIDIAGYSRLMGADEPGTLARLKEHRAAALPIAEAHGGRLVGSAGDGALWEFPSVVEAVAAAVEVQALMAERNRDLPDDGKMLYRIGINLGDVLVDGGEIYGDGVNVAARLESLAEPGGICMSRAARDQIRDRMDIGLADMGEFDVKNIARPVHVFRVLPAGAAVEAPKCVSRRRWHVAVVTAVLLAVIAGGVWWSAQENFELSSLMQSDAALPDTPSIAVLPFANLSGEKQQDPFADGISEDLTTQLSKISGLFVISRTTAFQYKGRSVDVRQAARELGVRYLVEGSVRRGGDQVRINAQLIDASTGGHLWAETFDGSADDGFALQDRINSRIVAALQVHLTPEEARRFASRGTESVGAYDAFLRGERLRLHGRLRSFEAAENSYRRAIELDPGFGAPYAGLSHVVWERARSYSSSGHREQLARAWELAEQSTALGEATLGHVMLARLHLWEKRDFEASESEARRAVARNPSDSESLATLAEVLLYAGNLGEARNTLEKAMRLDPGFPDRHDVLLAQIGFHGEEYQTALDHMQDACPRSVSHLRSACTLYRMSGYGHVGEFAAGRKIATGL